VGKGKWGRAAAREAVQAGSEMGNGRAGVGLTIFIHSFSYRPYDARDWTTAAECSWLAKDRQHWRTWYKK